MKKERHLHGPVGWFRKVEDPILLDFLKVWGKFEVKGHRQASVVTDRTDLDALIALTGLRKLPAFSGDEPGSGE